MEYLNVNLGTAPKRHRAEDVDCATPDARARGKGRDESGRWLRLAFWPAPYKGVLTCGLDAAEALRHERTLSRKWRIANAVFFATLAVLLAVAARSEYELVNQTGRLVATILGLSILPALLYRAARRMGGGDPPAVIMTGVLLAAALPNGAMAILLVVASVAPPQLADAIATWPSLVWVVGATPGLVLLLAYVGKVSVLQHLRERAVWSHVRDEAAATERELANARLAILQARIEPHFLYNTLANVQALIANRPAAAEEMLTSLICYLREALPRMRTAASTLQQEFALAQAYLDIARVRFGGRLTIEVKLQDAVMRTAFPPLIVQTLVENALKHGVEPKVGSATVRLEAFEEAGSITVRVSDDGPGFGELPGCGTGLRNIRERLNAIYGEDAALVIQPNSPSGITATVTVPRAAS